MSTNNRIVDTEQARETLVKYIMCKTMPFTCSITDGKHRTTPQNKLQRLWMVEIATQLGDRTPENVRGECKLMFGVPLLRRENDAFRLGYDKHVKPLPYETKLALMQEPISLPVTSIMTTRQLTDYLDEVHRHFSQQGLILTNPEDLKRRRAA
jgi:hypothetical protein